MFRMGGVDEADRLDSAEQKRVLRRTATMALPFRRTLIGAVAFTALSTLGLVIGPLLVRYGIDHGIDAGDSSVLRNAVIAYLVVVAAAYLASRQQYVLINRAGEGFLRSLRVRVFDHIQRQSLAFFDRNKSGVLIARMTADVESMGELVQFGLLQLISAAMLIVFSLVLLFVLSWQLAIVGLLVVPVIIVASRKFQRDSNEAYLDVRENVGQNLSTLQEGIAGVRVIQAYAREPEQTRRFVQSNRRLFDSHVRSVRVSTWYFGLVEACGIFATALVIGIGGWLVNRGDISIGTVIAAVLLLAQLFEPVQQLSQLYNTLQSSTAALNKLFGILDTEPDVVGGTATLPPSGAVTVDSIGFTYPGTDTPVLSDVSLTVGDGERLALVGPTGAGKSTLAKLMARLYDPSVGTISFGGVDLRDADLTELRHRIVVVPQEGFLFAGTIADNVRIARAGASDADVRNALAAIGALDRFDDFEQGIHTEVRERGSRLSAGERQLVSLARAALVDPAVLVLDEATSNLDPGTEVIVERALERLMTGRTTIVVAHRLSTVRRADRIAVVDHGELVELGTHDELVVLGGRYAALASAWQRSQPTA
jgi:ATP-binding cassette, subfamily B, bacterial